MKMNQRNKDLIRDNQDIWNCSAAKYFGVDDSSYLFKLFLKAINNDNRPTE